MTQEVFFANSRGQQLSGRLELPPGKKVHNYAIFAHCFTCSKNLTAVVNISRAMSQKGFGVLRFDFTGLGASEGNFEETDFSANVADLEAAAAFLKENHGTPSLLIGHSLGGSAVLLAAARLACVQAVVVIGAPAEPAHVKFLLQDSLEEIEQKGRAKVMLEGRPFNIRKDFLDDLLHHSVTRVVNELRKPLLIFHSPQDKIVSVENAEVLFRAAFHPKSFISLDGADHLLTNNSDSQYVGNVAAAWAARYLDVPAEAAIKTESSVAASLDRDDHFTTYLKLGNHSFVTDEPDRFGGNNFGPSPYELLSGALAACSAMTIQMYAHRKNWQVENVTIHIEHNKKHAKDCEACRQEDARIDNFTREISLTGKLTNEQKNRLLEIAEMCPVHKTLTAKAHIKSKLLD